MLNSRDSAGSYPDQRTDSGINIRGIEDLDEVVLRLERGGIQLPVATDEELTSHLDVCGECGREVCERVEEAKDIYRKEYLLLSVGTIESAVSIYAS